VTKDPKGVNWIKIGDTTDSKYITKTKEKIIEEGVSKSRYVEPGDFLLTNSMSFGRPYILKIDGCIHDGWLVLKPKSDQIFEDYFYYILGSPVMKREFKKKAKGTTVKNLNISLVSDVKIPLPSLSEQKAIVAKLDRAQRLIDIDREMLAKYDELIQSVFLEMFGDPVRNEKGWEVKKLGEVCNKITDGTHHSPDTFENEEYPYITAKHVDPFKVDFYSKPSYVKKEDHEKIYSRCNPEKGDVLLIKDGATTGKAAINPYDFEFSMLSSLALLKLDENQLRGNYLINVLNDERYKDLIRQKYMSGVAIKRYTLKKINQFEIPIPKIELQKQFDEIVANIDAEKQETLESSKKSEELFSSLVQGVFG